MQLHIDAVELRSRAPLLLNFQNGHVTEEFSRVNKSAVVLAGDGKTVVAAEIGDVLYAGEESQQELGKTLLLVRSHETGKVRVIEVGSALMRAVLPTGPEVTSEEVGVTTLDVSRKFGSKRDRQIMEQREKLKVDTETMNTQLQKVAEDVSAIEKIDLNTYSKNDSEDFYIPPINRDAQHVNDVYKIADILSEEQIEKIASEIETKDWRSELHPYVKMMLKTETNTEKALVLYGNCLLKMFMSLTKNIKKVYTVCTSSHTLNDVCCDNFTLMTNGRRSRSNQLKDKTLCHLIVVILLLNNFNFNLNEFSNAVKVSPATLMMKTRAVGAHTSSDKKRVVLKVPLNTAKSFLTRRKSAKF